MLRLVITGLSLGWPCNTDLGGGGGRQVAVAVQVAAVLRLRRAGEIGYVVVML